MPNQIDTVAPIAPPLKAKKPPYKLSMAVSEITPKAVEGPPNEELLQMHKEVHRLFTQHFRGNATPEIEGVRRVDLIAAHAAIAIELKERGYRHEQSVRILKSGKEALETQSPRGAQLFSRKIRMLVHSDLAGYPTDKPIVVVEGDQAIGEIRLTRPFSFVPSDFTSMQHLHGLTQQPTVQDLGDGTQQLYGFGVVVHRKYDTPKRAGKDRPTLQLN